jgi:adenylate cyclase
MLAADVASYTQLMEADAEGTVVAWKAARDGVVDPTVARHLGRLVKFTGDGFLAEFPTVQGAVNCALAMQHALADSLLKFRMGINLGDIIDDGRDIHGEGVNVAARLESLAEPGGICISGDVYNQVRNRVGAEYSDLGEHQVKHVTAPVRVYRVAARVSEAGSERMATQNPPLPEKPSIAVLPFDNMSGDPEQGYFADAVVETLTSELSRIRDFFVIARNSAFVYKGRSKNVREIGRELGVAYLVEGSVQRAGGRVRITVQLIETSGGTHIWAKHFDGSLDDIFDLQDEITAQVAGALQPSIRLAEIERSRRKRPQSMGAYDYTMRALSHVWLLEKEEASEALEQLHKALEIDPDYPLALALAAWCHAQSSVYNWAEDIEPEKEKALALAERAASLSHDDPLILTVLGTVHTFARNYGAARVLLQRAVALDPNSAWAHSRLGWLAAYTDRPEDAHKHFEKALRLSPVDPMNFNNYAGTACAFQVEGNDTAAAELFQRALDERRNAHWIHRNLAPALLGAGQEREARASFEALLAAYPDLTIKRYKDAMPTSPRVLDRIGQQLAQLGLPEG